jgi:hypothetical protein
MWQKVAGSIFRSLNVSYDVFPWPSRYGSIFGLMRAGRFLMDDRTARPASRAHAGDRSDSGVIAYFERAGLGELVNIPWPVLAEQASAQTWRCEARWRRLFTARRQREPPRQSNARGTAVRDDAARGVPDGPPDRGRSSPEARSDR